MKTLKKITSLCTFFTLLWANTLIASVPTLLRIHAAGNSMQNETDIYFDASGSFTYNPLNDAPSLGVNPGYLNIVTRFDSISYQIKCLPLLVQNISVPVKIVTGVSGVYQIYGSDIQNLPSGACIFLHDNFTNTTHDLRSGNYTCTISDTENVTRFVLNIGISIFPASGNFLNPTCSSSGDGFISANVPSGTGSWNYYWKDSLNTIIKTSLQKTTGDTLFGMNKGAYSVDITSNGTCSNGTVTFYLQGTQSPVASFITAADTNTINSPVTFTNTGINTNAYWWDFGDGMGTNNTNPAHYYTAPGTYTVTLTAKGSACADSSIYFKEIMITNQTTGITQTEGQNNNIFISRDETGYYIKLTNIVNSDVLISITNLFGQKVTDDIKVKGAKNEKIYITVSNYENQVLIISALSGSGEYSYKKILN
ncbi:MAG TPA: PKD domain-containing protein [Bacteroidia bacterium]|nr:PKD domain-containing protein [Bacteroidia bacterium]